MNCCWSDKHFMDVAAWKLKFSAFKDSKKTLIEVLSSGELPLADYMKWAAEHYKIPFLSDDFFAQAKNYKLILENPSAQWSEYFFPIHDWQGLLYIGCLEPQNFQYSKKTCMVLCSPKQLASLWSKMEAPPSITLAPSAPAIATAPSTPAAVPQVSAQAASKFRLEDTKSEVSTQVRVEATNTKTALTLEDKPRETSFKETVVIPTSRLQTPPQPPPVKINPNFSQSNYNIPEITNVVRAQGKSSDTNFTSTKTIMPFPDRTTQFTFIRTVYSDQVIIEAKAKIHENTDPQDALISAFRILKDYYKKLMWVVRDQKGSAYPIACNAEWEFTEEAWNLAMDFKTPNPFRIAKLTQKPFHGAISKNSASDAFFKQWGNGSYPDVISIVPVKLHGKVFGYFVGCDRGPHFNPDQSIELMESVCNELISAFVRIHKDLAKAS